jgi:hypothetical protein
MFAAVLVLGNTILSMNMEFPTVIERTKISGEFRGPDLIRPIIGLIYVGRTESFSATRGVLVAKIGNDRR